MKRKTTFASKLLADSVETSRKKVMKSPYEKDLVESLLALKRRPSPTLQDLDISEHTIMNAQSCGTRSIRSLDTCKESMNSPLNMNSQKFPFGQPLPPAPLLPRYSEGAIRPLNKRCFHNESNKNLQPNVVFNHNQLESENKCQNIENSPGYCDAMCSERLHQNVNEESNLIICTTISETKPLKHSESIPLY
jgi:hypothetical protein